MTNKSILAAFERMWQHVITNIETNGVSVGDTLPIESQVYFDGTEDEIPEGYVKVDAPFSNPNLLINGDFQVNQRGQTEYTNTVNNWQYNVDRWRLGDISGSKLVKNNDGTITITNLSSTKEIKFQQMLEKKLNGTYTISCEVISITGTSYIFDNSGTEHNLVVGKNFATRLCDNVNNIMIIIAPSSSITLKWVKLEQGSIATPFVPRLYAEELALCQRYYEITPQFSAYKYAGASHKYFQGIGFKVTKRVVPSIICGGLTDGGTNHTSKYNSATCDINGIAYFNLKEDLTGVGYLYSKFIADAEIY